MHRSVAVKCSQWEKTPTRSSSETERSPVLTGFSLVLNWSLNWSLKLRPSSRQQKQRQTTRVIQEARQPASLLSNAGKNSTGLIAVMCVGGVVISSAVIPPLLWWTREHETVAQREAWRSTQISWYGDGGDVSFDLAVTAREETRLADYLTCKSQEQLSLTLSRCYIMCSALLSYLCPHISPLRRQKHNTTLITPSLHCKRYFSTSHFTCYAAKNNSFICFTQNTFIFSVTHATLQKVNDLKQQFLYYTAKN